MKRLRFLAMVCLLITGLSVQADNKQTLTINGRTVDQKVKNIAFDGDKVVLLFTDGTSTTEDMSQVTLDIEWITTTAIEKVGQEPEFAEGSVYDLQGRRMESSIFNSQSSIQKKGIYLMRQNGKTVKVLKK